MGSFLSFLFSPDGVIAALLASALYVCVRPGSASARRFLVAAAVAYGVASIYAVPAAVARVLTHNYHRFDRADVGPARTAIVVLGGGSDTVDGWDGGRTGILGGDSAARVLEAARVSREIPDAVVVSSGGVPNDDLSKVPVGAVMRDRLVQLGVPAAQVVVEAVSHDTHDESIVIGPILRARAINQIVLVTSDVHMSRSVGAFRRQGWTVVPAIAPHPDFDMSWPRRLVPTPTGLYFSGAVVHELCGIPYYWMRGWWR